MPIIHHHRVGQIHRKHKLIEYGVLGEAREQVVGGYMDFFIGGFGFLFL